MHDESLLLRWLPRLRRYAHGLVRQTQDADDLVQDTLERAWTKSSHWSQVIDMRAWLFSLMHNLYVDRVRKSKLDTVDWTDEAESAPISAPQPMQHEVRDLDAALARLPAEHREVLLLVALEGMTYAEVAQTLDVPVGTVMSRLSRGRERLRLLMDGSEQTVPLKVVK